MADEQTIANELRREAADIRERMKQFCYGGECDGDMLDEDIGVQLVRASVLEEVAERLMAPPPPEGARVSSVQWTDGRSCPALSSENRSDVSS